MARNRKPDSETSILAPLIEFLEICSNQGKLRYFRAHPVRLVSKNGKTFPSKVRPSQRGAPDIFIFLPLTMVWIEGKSKTGRASNEQEEWRRWAALKGGHFRHEFAAHSVYRYFQPRTHGDVNAIIKWIRDRI